MMGKLKVFNCIYCARQVTGRHHAIASKNEYTHDVKAGLILRWAPMGFFVLLMHSCSILMNRALRPTACELHSTIPFLPKSDISWL